MDLLERLRDDSSDKRIGQFAGELLSRIEEDHAVLLALAEEVGGRSALKEATAWVAEKAARLKLRLGIDAELAVFEALEAISLGILGKLALWRALEVIAVEDARVRALPLDRLAARAEEQHADVEAFRLQAARVALRSD
jgi:hypothetical protein